MISHFAPLDPDESDPAALEETEILHLTDWGAQAAFGLSVLQSRGFFDGSGVPLLTWPFLDFVEGLDLRNETLLELGGGASTAWFARRFGQVRTLETDAAWCEKLAGNVEHIALDALESASFVYRNEGWMLVDFAGRRTRFLQRFLAAVPQGPPAVVLDNADWYRQGAGLLGARGYLEIPFHGFKSGQSWLSCTSLFIDPPRFAPRRRMPFWQPPFARRPVNSWDELA